MKFTLLFIFTLFFSITYGQNFNTITIDERANGKTFLDFLKETEDQYNLDFICNEDKMRALTINAVNGKQKLKDFLDSFLAAYQVIKVTEKLILIAPMKMTQNPAWKKQNVLVLKTRSSELIRFTGAVIDGKTNEPLTGARIYFEKLKKGDATNLEGQFSVGGIPQEILEVEIDFVGYQPESFIIAFSDHSNTEEFAVTLYPKSTELDEVTVTANRAAQNVLGNLSGVETLSTQTLKAIPTFLGEVDPIRSITTLPGVSTVGELASGFNVRGGESGQNLILQDGAPIYNPSHLFGFFSAFNPDMVSNVTLYKGGGPANYGGRISSVLDISLKRGDDNNHTITGAVGLVSSRLSVEGPIAKGKTSYLLGGRISYADWLVNATDNIQLKNSSANFSDVTGKIFHTLNDNNLFTVSLYRSFDSFKFDTDSVFSWGTTNISFKWDHTFSKKVFSTLNLYKSNYYSQVESLNEIDKFIYENSIDNLGFKYELSFAPNEKLKIIAGLEGVGTLLEPGILTPAGDAVNVYKEDISDQRSVEASVFAQADFDVSKKLSVSAGLRFSNFYRLGRDDIFKFDFTDIDGRYPAITDTIHYGSNEKIKTYRGVEPRVSIRYLLQEDKSVKLSYYRGFQYLHLISNTTSTTPQDYWITSGPYLKPQISDQYSLGYFQNFKSDTYEFALEGFYKNISNSVDYIEGADITMNPALEAGLLQGIGRAYGLEFFLKKKVGKLNGWVSYTYSRSLRKFDEDTGRLTINEGAYYAAAYDQPNRISVILNYKLGSRVVASANFNYSTGRPITIPISKFSYEGYLSVLNYSQRNEYRIPDYHRLDLSLTIKENPRVHHRVKSEWTFSIFNAYGRNNAYSIFFDKYGKAKKLSVLGSIFPSLTYSFKI